MPPKIPWAHIVDMIEKGWDVVVTHGNGPQVGFILTPVRIGQVMNCMKCRWTIAARTPRAPLAICSKKPYYNEFQRAAASRKMSQPWSPKPSSTRMTPLSKTQANRSAPSWKKLKRKTRAEQRRLVNRGRRRSRLAAGCTLAPPRGRIVEAPVIDTLVQGWHHRGWCGRRRYPCRGR